MCSKPSSSATNVPSFLPSKKWHGEFAARKRKQREEEHERRRSVWAASDRASVMAPNGMPVPPLPLWLKDMTEKEESQDSKAKLERDLRRANELTDNLSVAIALRDWDEAIAMVDSGGINCLIVFKDSLSQASRESMKALPSLVSKLPPLKASLTRSLA